MLIKQLVEIDGVSGNEDKVREFIVENIKTNVDEITIDDIGNIIALKRGRDGKLRVMLSAHMDEVGFICTGYTDTGMVKFKAVGGIDERILPGKRVIAGENKVRGVIGCKAIHLQEKESRDNVIKAKNLYIDIGASSKEEAEKLLPLGEYISFQGEYEEYGDNVIKAKALDDRAGCAIIMEIINEKKQYDFDLYACFTVQEEIGLRGAETASYQVNPDVAIVVEGTTCSDVPGVEGQDQSTRLGEGAALSVMDRSAYYDPALTKFLYKTAVDNSIKVQYKQTATGGNDAGKIQTSRTGVKVAAVSVPVRYIHSPISLMDRRDYNSSKELILKILEQLDKNGGKYNV